VDGGPFDTIEARGVGKVYGRQRALAPVSLTLRAGDAVALLGANGAGKSTLVSILATLVRPTSGEVLFDGGRPDKRARGGIGVIAHDSLCYGDLTARENLAFFAALQHVPDAEARARELLDRVSLTDAADRPARTFSRGMLQRLAIARALLHRPRLLLLDEPFTGLDREGQEMLVTVLREERARGAILVVVTHDLEPLPQLVERVLVLRRGRLVFDGPGPDGYAGYRTLYREHAGSV
jgi:heme exporter protein A